MSNIMETGAMSGIVETVGRAIADADMEDYMEFHHLHDARAQAAIRATIEHLSENVSYGMREEAVCINGIPLGADEDDETRAIDTFRAMLSQALKEITRSQALDELGELDGALLRESISDLDHSKAPEVTR